MPANLIAAPATAGITVANPGGAVSNAASLPIVALTITSLNPAAAKKKTA